MGPFRMRLSQNALKSVRLLLTFSCVLFALFALFASFALFDKSKQSSRDVQAHVEVLPTWPNMNLKIPSYYSINYTMPKHVDMIGSLLYHGGMELDQVFHIKEFDEFFRPERKERLSPNDIESIIDDSRSDFIDSMSTSRLKLPA